MTLKDNLIRLRKMHGLSQEQFAEKLNVSRQAISKWENGDSMPDTENLIQISKLFSVSLDELVGNEIPEKNEKQLFGNDEQIPATPLIYKKKRSQLDKLKNLLDGMICIVATVIFFWLGMAFNMWYISWISFLSIPIAHSIFDCIKNRTLKNFAWPVFITAIYMIIGFRGYWHPGWVIFLSIPAFYSLVAFFEDFRKD